MSNFEGVLFKSVPREGGTNIVLFQGQDDRVPLTFVNESFELFSTSSVEYEHRKLYVGKHDDGEVWISYSDL